MSGTTKRTLDAMERLREENERLRAALRTLVECLNLAELNDDLPLPFAGHGYDLLDNARKILNPN